MFLKYFGLQCRPFSKTPDPRFLFYSKSHEEALARLQIGVEEKEIILLTGEVGSGKTTLSRALMDSLDDRYRIISILNPRLTAAQFLRIVARRFGINFNQPKDDLLEDLNGKVYEDYTNGITPVIIVDEAQLIPDRSTFEEIRLLTNFQLDHENLLSLVLIGQPDLNRRIKRKAYLPLRQRIGIFYHLRQLSNDEVKHYLVHRLKIAGRTEPLFSDDAIEAISRYSQGIPRSVNNIAYNSLLGAFSLEVDRIDDEIIQDVAHELGMNGVK